MTEQLQHPAEQYPHDEDQMPEIGTVQRALWLAHWHMAWESEQQYDKLAAIYHPDVEWEIPGRRIYVRGDIDTIIAHYRAIGESLEVLSVRHNERYGSAERVFDDSEAVVRLISDHGFPNSPMPVGSIVDFRMIHNFHIKDGLIVRENSYELWRTPVEQQSNP